MSATVSGGTTAGAGAAAAIAQAIKASGVIVTCLPGEFMRIISKTQHPLIVSTTGGFLKKNYQYLTSYKGLAFYTKAPEPINLPSGTELVSAEKIWIP